MGVKVGDGGKLYGSITAKDIAEALARRGIDVDRHKVDLEEPLKSLGTYKVAVKVFSGHDARGHGRRRAEGLTRAVEAAVRDAAPRGTMAHSTHHPCRGPVVASRLRSDGRRGRTRVLLADRAGARTRCHSRRRSRELFI